MSLIKTESEVIHDALIAAIMEKNVRINELHGKFLDAIEMTKEIKCIINSIREHGNLSVHQIDALLEICGLIDNFY